MGMVMRLEWVKLADWLVFVWWRKKEEKKGMRVVDDVVGRKYDVVKLTLAPFFLFSFLFLEEKKQERETEKSVCLV